MRTQPGVPPHLTDKEVFEMLPSGDPWHDGQMLEVWDYLYKHPRTKIPDSWEKCLKDFDTELRNTLGQ